MGEIISSFGIQNSGCSGLIRQVMIFCISIDLKRIKEHIVAIGMNIIPYFRMTRYNILFLAICTRHRKNEI